MYYFPIALTSDLDIFHADVLALHDLDSVEIDQSPQYKKWTDMDTSKYH